MQLSQREGHKTIDIYCVYTWDICSINIRSQHHTQSRKTAWHLLNLRSWNAIVLTGKMSPDLINSDA